MYRGSRAIFTIKSLMQLFTLKSLQKQKLLGIIRTCLYIDDNARRSNYPHPSQSIPSVNPNVIISHKPLVINLNVGIGYLKSSRGISESNTHHNPSPMTCGRFPLLILFMDIATNHHRVASSILSRLPSALFLFASTHNVYYLCNPPFVHTSFPIAVLAQVTLLGKGIGTCQFDVWSFDSGMFGCICVRVEEYRVAIARRMSAAWSVQFPDILTILGRYCLFRWLE
jgi:hypothetical protein